MDIQKWIWLNDKYLESLAIEIDNVELVSLDIFDTLLFRMCAKPSDIFLRIGEKAKELNYLQEEISAFEFSRIRILAEQNARSNCLEKKNTKEVTLDDIYINIPTHISNKEKIKKLEMNTECEYCYLNPFMVSFINYCLQENKKIVLVSDMYLSKKQIMQILIYNKLPLNILNNLDIIVSNEFGCSKVNGRLFKVVKKKYKSIPTSKMIHIGDNKIADIEGAEKSGIKSIYYEVIHSYSKLNSFMELEKIRFGSILTPLHSIRKIALSISNKEKGEDPFWFNIGAGIIGPFLTFFSEWIVDICERERINLVLPFMREGEILSKFIKKTAHSRGLNLLVNPFYISRHASYLASIDVFSEQELNEVFERINVTIFDLFKIYKLDHYLYKFEDFKNIPLKESHQIKISEEKNLKEELYIFFLSEKIKNEINKTIRLQQDLLKKYFLELSNNNQRVITVDIGFRGTIQNNLEKMKKNTGIKVNMVHLLAMGAKETERMLLENVDIRGWLGNAGYNYQHIKKIMSCPELIEELILAFCGSTLDYEKNNNGKIIPLLDELNINKEEIAYKENSQNGMLYFQDLWIALKEEKQFISKELKNKKTEWLKLLYRLIEFPTSEEAFKLGNLHHDDNNGSSNISTIISKKDRLLLNKLGENEFLFSGKYGYHLMNWPQGVITEQNPSFFLLKYLQESEENNYYTIMSEMVYQIKMNKENSIVIYGAGEVGDALLELCSLEDIEVEYIVDRKSSLWGNQRGEKTIISLEEAFMKSSHVYAIASIAFAKEIELEIQKRYRESDIKPVIFSINELRYRRYK